MDQSCAAQNRRSNRSPVLLSARIEVAGRVVAVRLRNLSASGALIESDTLPQVQESVVFERGELRVPAHVVWTESRFAGLSFERVLAREEVLRQIPKPREKIEPRFRRPSLACRPLTEADRLMVQMWGTPKVFKD